MVAEVLIHGKNINQTFDYLIPAHLNVTFGVGVMVPFYRSFEMGYVLKIKDSSDFGPLSTLKEVESVLSPVPLLTEDMLHLSAQMAALYGTSLITALMTVLPGFMGFKKAVVYELQEGPMELEDYLKHHQDAGLKDLEEQFGEDTIKALLEEGTLRQKTIFIPKQKAKKITTLKRTGKAPENDKEEVVATFLTHIESATLKEIKDFTFMSDYAIKKMVENGFLQKKMTTAYRNPMVDPSFMKEKEITLTKEQEDTLEGIRESFTHHPEKPVLLMGVTGSGKTVLYERLLKEALCKGQGAMILVPEIALIPQVYGRFVALFGEKVAVLHSHMSMGEKFDQYCQIAQGNKPIVIGPRSAVFSPVKDLGLIVIDEEHEDSYKEEQRALRYHAREVALLRSHQRGTHLLLGSATPSLDSYDKAFCRKMYGGFRLDTRVNQTKPPKMTIIDMKNEPYDTILSASMKKALVDCYQQGKKSILLLNRRGYHQFLMCRHCGEVVLCPHCDVPLKYHKTIDRLMCHYCGYSVKGIKTCPTCKSPHLYPNGMGTQRIEEEVAKLLPKGKIIRMDADTTNTKNAHQKLLSTYMEEGDVLIGTQMIAKGLDIDTVTLVGILSVDSMLYGDHFKSAEKTCQLLNQVAGRAGRGAYKGEVLLQTFDPDHYAILGADDYDGFVNTELQIRKKLHYPPYFHLYRITMQGGSEERVEKDLMMIKELLKKKLKNTILIGPAPLEIKKIKDQYYYGLTIKSQHKIKDVVAAIGATKKNINQSHTLVIDRL